jgi:hypothetical protein
MELLSFIKEAGEKLFGKSVKAAEADPAQAEAANRDAATAIENHLRKYGRQRRHPVEDRQAVLWQRQRVPAHLRGEQADAGASGQDLPGPESAHTAQVRSRPSEISAERGLASERSLRQR